VSRPSSGHIPALDGVRGLAILLVLLFHFRIGHGLPPPTIVIDRLFDAACGAGWIGVDLFFVLSGFLITGVLYDAKGSNHYFRNFYARRCLRIFPLYYVALILFLGVIPRLLDLDRVLQPSRGAAVAYSTYLSNVWIAYKGWTGSGLAGHFWSLAVEEQFYFVWPIIVMTTGRRALLRVCAGSVVGALVVRVMLRMSGYEDAAYVVTPARIDALAIGGFLAVAARGPDGLSAVARMATPTAIVTASALISISLWRRGFDHGDLVVATVGHSLLAVFFGSLLVAALASTRRGLLGRCLLSRVLRFFGQYSYALYVFQYPLPFLKPSFLSFASVPTLYGSQLPAQVLYLSLGVLAATGLAVLSWHGCEKHFLKLKKFVPNRPRVVETVGAVAHQRQLSVASPV